MRCVWSLKSCTARSGQRRGDCAKPELLRDARAERPNRGAAGPCWSSPSSVGAPRFSEERCVKKLPRDSWLARCTNGDPAKTQAQRCVKTSWDIRP
eukprot:1180322-Alexandrium_andersonii.AAC.1